MANPVSKLTWKVLTLSIGIPVGIAAKKGVERAWVAVRPNSPRAASKDQDASWKDAIGWAALSAAGVATAQLVTSKGAATLWRGLIGSEPPAAKPSKAASKRAAKASPPPTAPTP